jgi:hypothetical protein
VGTISGTAKYLKEQNQILEFLALMLWFSIEKISLKPEELIMMKFIHTE